MVECITEQGGILDKFIGDAIMAAFGLPVTFDDDEDRSLKASINMINRLGLGIGSGESGNSAARDGYRFEY